MAELVKSRETLPSPLPTSEGIGKIVIFSAKRHLDEVISGKPLRQIFTDADVRFFESEDINTDERLKQEVTPNTLGLAMGAAWVFGKSTVDLFAPNHLLDFMGIDLPRYRGGAHYTWAVLHQNKKGCANLQVILGGRETFHRGPLVRREEYELLEMKNEKGKMKNGGIKPKDFFDTMSKKEAKCISTFLADVQTRKEFELTELDESQSSYYPPLHTKSHGLINWSWSGHDIALFINAFDEPYPGASTFIGSKKVFLKDCTLLAAEEAYHPFTSGIVVRKNDKGIFVATVGGLLLIKKISDENENDMIGAVELGQRLYTPSIEIDRAMGFAAVYDAEGLRK